MKDRVPLYPGRVKLTPVSGHENTYDMVRADEPTQEGTPLSKSTFLKDDTAAMFGLSADAVPDDVFKEITNFCNFYVWGKATELLVHDEVNQTNKRFVQLSSSAPNYIHYGDEYKYNDDGTLTILNENKIRAYDSNYNSIISALKGKYATTSQHGTVTINSLTYFPDDTTFSQEFEQSTYFYYLTASKSVLIKNFRYENVVQSYALTPTNTTPVEEGYTFINKGQLGAFGNDGNDRAKIATGSYTGIGTYGAGNKNELTFDFEPTVVIVMGTNQPAVFVKKDAATSTNFMGCGGSSYLSCNYQFDGATLSYWAVSDYDINFATGSGGSSGRGATNQLNVSGQVYNYVAIG